MGFPYYQVLKYKDLSYSDGKRLGVLETKNLPTGIVQSRYPILVGIVALPTSQAASVRLC